MSADSLTVRELQSLRNLGGDVERAADELTRLREESATYKRAAEMNEALAHRYEDQRNEARAALAQAGVGQEPVGVLERGEGGAFKVRPDMENLRAIYSLPAGKHPLYAHPAPAQREPPHVPPLPFAVFDEFGRGADDRVHAYAIVHATAASTHAAPAQREPLSDAQIDALPITPLTGRRQIVEITQAACAAAWGVKLADSGTKGAA